MQGHKANQSPPAGSALVDRLAQPRRFAPLLLGLSALLCAALLDRGLPPNDEGALLTNAAKILRGAVFYDQIDSYPFPGSHYLLAGAMALFGEEVRVARGLAALFYCGMVLALYASALRVLPPRRAALFGLALLCFKLLAWPAFTAYMYSDVSFTFGCIAIALLLGYAHRGPTLSLGLAGACVALSLASKQNLGIYLALTGAALLAWPELLLRAPPALRRGAALAVFVAGAALPLLAMLAWFAAQGVLSGLLHSGLVRPFTGYLPTSSISFAAPLAWWRLGAFEGVPGFSYFVGPLWALLSQKRLPGASLYPAYWLAGEIFTRLLYTAIPLVFLALLVRWWRSPRPATAADSRRFALALLAAAALLSAFPRADFFHLISVCPVVLLAGFALGGSGRWARLESAGVLALLGVCGLLLALYRAALDVPFELPRARLRVASGEAWVAPVVRFVQAELAPDEELFVLGHEATFYFLSDRYNRWPFAQLYPGQAGGDGGAALVRQLERDPPKLMLRGVLSWPGLPALPEYAPALLAFARANFQPDPSVFARHPVRGGPPPPPGMFAVLRLRAAAR